MLGAIGAYRLRRDKHRRRGLCGNGGYLGAGKPYWQSNLPEGELMGLFHFIRFHGERVRPGAKLGREWIDKEEQGGRNSRVLWLPNLPKFIIAGAIVVGTRLLVLIVRGGPSNNCTLVEIALLNVDNGSSHNGVRLGEGVGNGGRKPR